MQYPIKRKITDPKLLGKVAMMLDAGVDKKKIRQYLISDSGKCVSAKDVQNIAANISKARKLSEKSPKTRNRNNI